MHTHRMQSQDCWYWTPVAVAVTPWMVSDSRWTGVTGAVVRERSEVTAHSKHTRIHTHFLFLVQLTSVTIGNGNSQTVSLASWLVMQTLLTKTT